MHIVFLNPQGNFDPKDSYLTEHPDFGGQLVYVKEVAQAMVDLGHRVDIVTRRIRDVDWPEFAENQDFYPDYAENLRILRFPCGGDCFLEKEKLWPHMPAFINAMLDFYGEALPDVATGHYADGGYCAVLTKAKTGIPFTFTGHSLGAQKLEKLGTNTANWLDMEARYCFSRRIAAERISMTHAARIIVSTSQEQQEQYAHSLYAGAVDASDNQKFAVTPPGVNQRIFAIEATQLDNDVSAALDARFGADRGPCTVVSSRLDEKKNIIGVVKAYAGNADLRRRAALVLCVRGIDDPETDIVKLGSAEKKVLREILDVINQAAMGDRVHFLNIGSQLELAATYRYFARRSSVFALTSFYEPFGLAPIEAAATGLAPVVTQNGGPSEIFEDGSGVLVDPFSVDHIAEGLLDGLSRHATLAAAAFRRVQETYTWRQTAEGYLSAINMAHSDNLRQSILPSEQLDETARIQNYLGAVE